MMLRPPTSDFWQVGVVPAPLRELLAPYWLPTLRDRIAWLPDPGPWRYLADPFGVQRAGTTHVFVEAFDYRRKHAVIERHEFGAGLAWRGKEVALARPFHLSYPFIVEAEGEVFMIPESHRANEIALYRARKFPGDWVREATLLAGVPGAEASVIRHRGRWWMFFTIVGANARDQRELHVAWAEQLTGPWQLHPLNPVLVDGAGARPGGTPIVTDDGAVMLPVQDCSETYGGAIRLLRFDVLEPEDISARHVGVRLTGELVSDSHEDGFHTLAACGDCTLIDVKRIERSWARPVVDLGRRLRRMGQRFCGQAAMAQESGGAGAMKNSPGPRKPSSAPERGLDSSLRGG